MKTPVSRLSALFCLLLVLVTSCKKDPDPVAAKSSAKALSSFTFGSLSPAVTATVSGNTVMATVPFGTNVTALAPTISLSDKATVSPASGVAQNFSNSVNYTVTAEDGSTQVYAVAVGVGVAPKSPAKDITAFAFNGITPAVNCTIDAVTKVISGTLPASADLTKLVPTLTLSPKATVTPATGVVQDFSKAVTYTVTAEDGTTQVYSTTMTVAQPVLTNICRVVSSMDTYPDGTSATTTYELNAQNRLAKKVLTGSDATITTIETYDLDGFRTQEKITYSYKTASKFSLKDQITTDTYSGGRLVKTVYAVTFADPSVTGYGYTYEYSYDAQGAIIKQVSDDFRQTAQNETTTFANGIATSVASKGNIYELNAQGFVTRLTTIGTSGNIYSLFKYNAAGQQISNEKYTPKGVRYINYQYEYSSVKANLPVNPLGYKGHPAFIPSAYGSSGGFPQTKSVQYLGDIDTGKETLNRQDDYSRQVDSRGNLTSLIWTQTYSTGTPSVFKTTYQYEGCK